MEDPTIDPPATYQQNALRLCALLLGAAALYTLSPLWTAVVLAAWVGKLARPLVRRFSRAVGGRERAAAVLTLLLLLALVVPCILLLAALSSDAIDLVRRVMSSQGGRGALEAIVSGGGGGGAESVPFTWRSFGFSQALDLIKQYGENALRVLQTVAGAAAEVALWLFLFLLGSYTFLTDGPRAYRWLEARAPLHPRHTKRLVGAFHETGRGLLIGVGLTALVQGLGATVTYVALGVPRALVLGALTCFAALIPSFGTALVWVPVAAGLALAGRRVPAIILAVVGTLVISSLDNILRPLLSRVGELQMPGFVMLTAMFGGLSVFGTWGLVLGPLIVRLLMEVLAILREESAWGLGQPKPAPEEPTSDETDPPGRVDAERPSLVETPPPSRMA
ncbi:MAG: AI-2E family transporter [Polyangiaceae bacterium]|jgi:predicted PurR-regulated permease PerM|nr:AI-2E family transporter [Polyangiaceae bacterium]